MKRALLIHGLVVSAILCVALLPLFSTMAAGIAADRYDCRLDEGSIHPCIVNGRDIGGDLYTLGMMGWLMIATIPLGLAVAAGYITLVGLFYLVRAFLRRRQSSP